MFDQTAFGEKLRSHRKAKNFTQEEVAEMIGVSGQAVSKWENGECLPDCYNLKMLGQVYRVSVDSLLDTEERPREKAVGTINVNGAVFEVVERPETLYAGKFTFAKDLTEKFDFIESLDETQRRYAMDKVIHRADPKRDVIISVNFWQMGKKLHGMGFVHETTSELQSEGVDVFKMPASLFIKFYTDKASANLLAKDTCEPWELFAYIRQYIMPAHGFKMADNGAQEIEVYDTAEHKSGYGYVPVIKK